MRLYIMRNGERMGPYSLDDARRLREAGQVTDADLAWHEGIAGWVALGEVQGLGQVAVTPVKSPVPFQPIPANLPTETALPDDSLLTRRLLTVFGLGALLFFFLFFVFFFLAIVVGSGIAGGIASAAQHAQGYDEGVRIGQDAAKQFMDKYGAIFAGCSLLGSLLVSTAISFAVAFSNLLPWCRRRT